MAKEQDLFHKKYDVLKKLLCIAAQYGLNALVSASAMVAKR